MANEDPTPEQQPAERALADVDVVTDASLSFLSLEDLLMELLDRVSDAVGGDTAAILLLDEARGVLVARAAKGIEEEVRRGVTIPVGAGFAGRIAHERAPLAIADLEEADVLNPLLRERGIASLLGVPLLIDGRVMGVLHVGTLKRREFTEADIRVLRVAADRAATAIDRARMNEQRHLAESLQRALMPARLPDMPGLRFAGRYRPAPAGAQLGGDWYDTFGLPDGRVALVVGDVVGRGAPAATLMAQMRSALRAFASEGHSPVDIVTRLNDLLMRDADDATATMILIALDQETNRIAAVSAGHPPPLLIPQGGEARYLDLRVGPPVGATRIPRFHQGEVEMPSQALLLLYTDGLVERRDEPLDVGLERLRLVAEATDPSAPQRFCDRVLSDLLEGVEQRDDVALMVMLTQPLGPHLRLRLAADPEALSTLRRQLARWLRENGVEDQTAFDVVLAASEAGANAAEHAYSPRGGHFEVEALREGDHVVIRVTDDGTWRPEGERDRGRGLMLMRGLTDDVSIERGDPEGTIVTLRRHVGSGRE